MFNFQDDFENKLLKGTQQLFQSVESLRMQLKRIGLIEDERIHLIERVYSLPSSQRQYYAHLMMLEREKIRLREEIEELKEKQTNLKETTQILQEAVEAKVHYKLYKCCNFSQTINSFSIFSRQIQ